MDLRNLPEGLSPGQRCDERRQRIEEELDLDLSSLAIGTPGTADEKNCEQMFGAVPVPVGYAGPLTVHFSSQEKREIHLPLATTEGALVASVNRGCKALREAGGAYVTSIHHGISRSIALKPKRGKRQTTEAIHASKDEWIAVGMGTSKHLKIMGYNVDEEGEYLFLTINADTDEAMGMNMVTLAAQAIGDWIAENHDASHVTVAGNVDSDKKPSQRTKDRGRGYEVIAQATFMQRTVESILKATPEHILEVACAKLQCGSTVAGALGRNLHVANVIAALYLATGQDAAHVVEASMADTTFLEDAGGFSVRVRIPAILVGVRGGGTGLPAQSQCLGMLMGEKTSLRPVAQLAESIGAAVLAGEVSLLAALASHQLASSHKKMGR